MACDFTQLQHAMQWAYDNNSEARRLIQEGVMDGGKPGVEKIKRGYKIGQAHNVEEHKHLVSCGPLEILRAAKAITGV